MTVTDARALAHSAHGDQRDRAGSLHVDHAARAVAAVLWARSAGPA